MTYNSLVNGSALAAPILMQNFCPQLSASLSVAGTSASVTFATLTGRLRQTFMITNKGTHGAYLGWGNTTATAVASSGAPAANCAYIAAGAILTLDFQNSTGTVVDTVAAIQDGGTTTLEISIGYGQ